VVTVDPVTGERKVSKVIGWHKNKRLGRKMLRVSYKGAHKHKGYLSGPIVTEDHLILTTNGWKEAGKLTEVDVLVTHEPKPNPKQYALIVGTLLGDASLSKPRKTNERSQLIMGQSIEQKEWLEIKKAALKDFMFSSTKNRANNSFCATSSKYYACMMDLREQFYPDGTKIVPKTLVEKYFSPALLAAWFLDDGCVSRSSNHTTLNARLATQGFSEEDVIWLVDFLNKKGFMCYTYPMKIKGYNKIYYEIRFNVNGTKALFDYIRKAVPESLSHKIDYAEYDDQFWKDGFIAETYCANAVVDKDIYQHPHGVYCLDVEGTHAFVSSEVVVHNCGPTYYGLTKRLGEGLFREAVTWSKTSFLSVRYGNVLKSANSIVPLFERQITQDKPFTVTDTRMTRFWLSMQQAIDLILYTLEFNEPGTIVVPKAPAMSIVDLAQTLDPEREIVEIGIRPGERLHETLVVREEAQHTVDIGDHFIIYPPTNLTVGNVPFQYEYTSDNPAHQLTSQEMLEMLENS
jgi:nucleoside-diphosphate-sugar epimerase